jgi:hypothetical protein
VQLSLFWRDHALPNLWQTVGRLRRWAIPARADRVVSRALAVLTRYRRRRFMLSTRLTIMLVKRALFLIGVLGVVACQPHSVRNEGPQDVRNGSVLTLKRNLSIPTGSPFIYFQDQHMLAPESLRANYPYCRFGLDDPASVVREVQPNAFVVIGVDYDERSIGSSGEAVSATRMNLQTELGAKGYHMTCMLPASGGYTRFITVAEIRGAVGEFFILNPTD